MHVERQERVGHAGIIQRGAMRSSAQEECEGAVWDAAHLRGKWWVSHIGRRASAMRDLLTTADGAVEQVFGTAGCFFPGQPFVQIVSTLVFT